MLLPANNFRYIARQMKSHITIIAILISVLPGLAMADIKELSQAELRAAVAERGAISTRSLISGVEDFTGGSVLDIRAFDVDGVVTYRIVVSQDDGQVSTLMVDGATGRAVSATSAVGKQVVLLSAATEGTPQLSNNGNGRGNANGRGNGRGNGNSGGNGNGGGNGGGGGGGKNK